jgi:hypothetical protein
MANFKVSKQIMTGYPLASRWYATLVSGLTGLAVAHHFPKVTNFVKISHFRQKNITFSKLSQKVSFYESNTKLWWWVDLHAHIRNNPVGNAVWLQRAFEKNTKFCQQGPKNTHFANKKRNFLKIEPKNDILWI